jgi:hypothetical protein
MIIMAGWWLTNPPEKYESQIGSSSQPLGKIKNVPNHQAVYCFTHEPIQSIPLVKWPAGTLQP